MRSALFVIGLLLSAITAALYWFSSPGSILVLATLLAFHGACVFHVIAAPWLLMIMREQGLSSVNIVILGYLIAVFVVGGFGMYQLYVVRDAAVVSPDIIDRTPSESLRIVARQIHSDAERNEPVDRELLGRALALISAGAEVNQRDDRLEPALWYAARSGSEELVDILLSAGARLDDETLYSTSPLLEAVAEEHYEVADRLLSAGANPNYIASSGLTPLLAAARNGDIDFVRRLLDAGAEPKRQDDTGGTAVLAALESGRSDILELLLSRGALTVLPDWDFKLPMQIALERQDFDSVRLLEQYAEGFEAQTRSSPPILFWVFEKCDLALFKRLLDMGADPDVRVRSTGQTLFHRILRRPICENRDEFLSALLESDVDVNLLNGEGESIFLVALYENNAPIARRLVEKGAIITGRNRLDRDVLHLSARHGINDLLQAGIHAGLDINRRSAGRNGTTPLDEAVAGRHADTTTLIFEAGGQLPTETSNLQNLYRHAGADVAVMRVVLEAYLKTERNPRSDRLFYVWVERANNPEALVLLETEGIVRDPG